MFWTAAGRPARSNCAHRPGLRPGPHISANCPSVVFASERMDDNPAWRLLEPGELAHVDADLNIERRLAFPDPLRHLLRHSDLSPIAQSAQREQKA